MDCVVYPNRMRPWAYAYPNRTANKAGSYKYALRVHIPIYQSIYAPLNRDALALPHNILASIEKHWIVSSNLAVPRILTGDIRMRFRDAIIWRKSQRPNVSKAMRTYHMIYLRRVHNNVILSLVREVYCGPLRRFGICLRLPVNMNMNTQLQY